MKNFFKDKSILHFIIGVLVIGYAFFGTDFIKNVKDDTKNATASVASSEKLDVNSTLSVTFIDVGQADSILITNNNHNMLIDAGNNEDGPLLVSYLKDKEITSFDYVVATHPHEDHIGGMDDIINNFDIDTFYMTDAKTTTKTFLDVLNSLEDKNLSYIVPQTNETFKLGDIDLKVLYSSSSCSNNLNMCSIVIRLDFKDTSFLFMGDAPSEVENKLLDKNIDADVLKVGHHGSTYSTSDKFLEKVSPSYAVISVGANNSYNHPGATTINKLKNMGVDILRTDKKGSITFKSDGNKLDISYEKTNTNG